MIRAFLIGLTVFTLSACETTKGVGRDVQKAGDAITGAAQDVQNAL